MNDGRTDAGRKLAEALTQAFALECDIARAFAVDGTLEMATVLYLVGDINESDLMALTEIMEDRMFATGQATEDELNAIRELTGVEPRQFSAGSAGPVEPQYVGREFIAA